MRQSGVEEAPRQLLGRRRVGDGLSGGEPVDQVSASVGESEEPGWGPAEQHGMTSDPARPRGRARSETRREGHPGRRWAQPVALLRYSRP